MKGDIVRNMEDLVVGKTYLIKSLNKGDAFLPDKTDPVIGRQFAAVTSTLIYYTKILEKVVIDQSDRRGLYGFMNGFVAIEQ